MKRSPKLRLKGHEKDELVEHKLNELVEFKSGGTPSMDNSNFWNGDIPWISASTMAGKYYSKSDRMITAEGLANGSRLAQKGTLLLLTRGSMLFNKIPIGITEVDVAFNQDLKNLIVSSKTSSEFIYQWFQAEETSLLNKVVGTGIGAGKLETDDLKNLSIHLPSLPEQQKIASFLSAIDEKIQQLTRKRELLEQYKKGVMQQIFSGKLRFKDDKGREFPKWLTKTFGEVYTFNSTNSFSRNDLNYEHGTIKNIHYGDIHTKFSSHFDITQELVPFLNPDVNLKGVKEENFCREGDVIIADASEDDTDIGKAIEIVKLNDEKVLAGLHTFLARPDGSIFKGFSTYLLQTSYVKKQIRRMSQGTKVYSISTGRLGKVNIDLPNLAEQQKIVAFLSAIDIKIKTTSKEILKTTEFKKGLLQQMFV